MSTFELTPQAIDDLDAIWSFIAAESRDAACRVETEIEDTCRKLAAFPLMGHARRDITQLPVRFWTLPKFPNYVIVYRDGTRPMQVVAVLHGRNLRQLLEERL